MTLEQWKKKLEPHLTAVHGVLSVEVGKVGLTVCVAKITKTVQDGVYDVFENFAAELPFMIKPMN